MIIVSDGSGWGRGPIRGVWGRSPHRGGGRSPHRYRLQPARVVSRCFSNVSQNGFLMHVSPVHEVETDGSHSLPLWLHEPVTAAPGRISRMVIVLVSMMKFC